MSESFLLAGDIGATNTKLAFYSADKGLFQPAHQTALENKDYKSFDELLESYLGQNQLEFHGICLGIAGPVRNNSVQITNLDWEIDGYDLQQRY